MSVIVDVVKFSWCNFRPLHPITESSLDPFSAGRDGNVVHDLPCGECGSRRLRETLRSDYSVEYYVVRFSGRAKGVTSRRRSVTRGEGIRWSHVTRLP